MKKRLIVFLALMALAIPTICSATPPNQGAYVSGFAGVAIPSDADATGPNLDDRVSFDPGAYVGGTGGFDFGYLRLEGELSYKRGEIARVNDRLRGNTYRDIDDSVGVLAMMGNAFLDMHNPSPITPYLGGGIGLATIYLEDTFGSSPSTGFQRLYEKDDDTVFAYQAGAGLEININRILSLDLGYRYFRTLRASFTDRSNDHEMRFESHNLAAGIRVKF